MRSKASLTLATAALSSIITLAAGCAGDLGEGADDVETKTGAIVATFTPLTLINGWLNAPFNTAPAATALGDGFVYFRGAINTAGTNASPFVLPVGRRPSSTIFLNVDLCNSVKGRMSIFPNGGVTIADKGGVLSAARCFTSLEGLSFPVSNAGYLPLVLQNGWFNVGGNMRTAAVTVFSNIVHLTGTIKTAGTNSLAFTMPADMRPFANVYVPIDVCNGNKGRLLFTPAGSVFVQTEGSFSDAQCLTSLEGVTYSIVNTPNFGWTCLTPTNGWVPMPFTTRNTCVKNVDGLIRLSGAASTTGTNLDALTLPAAMRPLKDVYTAIDLCGATNGRVHIAPTGVVSVQSEGAVANAQCFSSFEGAFFSR